MQSCNSGDISLNLRLVRPEVDISGNRNEGAFVNFRDIEARIKGLRTQLSQFPEACIGVTLRQTRDIDPKPDSLSPLLLGDSQWLIEGTVFRAVPEAHGKSVTRRFQIEIRSRHHYDTYPKLNVWLGSARELLEAIPEPQQALLWRLPGTHAPTSNEALWLDFVFELLWLEAEEFRQCQTTADTGRPFMEDLSTASTVANFQDQWNEVICLSTKIIGAAQIEQLAPVTILEQELVRAKELVQSANSKTQKSSDSTINKELLECRSQLFGKFSEAYRSIASLLPPTPDKEEDLESDRWQQSLECQIRNQLCKISQPNLCSRARIRSLDLGRRFPLKPAENEDPASEVTPPTVVARIEDVVAVFEAALTWIEYEVVESGDATLVTAEDIAKCVRALNDNLRRYESRNIRNWLGKHPELEFGNATTTTKKWKWGKVYKFVIENPGSMPPDLKKVKWVNQFSAMKKRDENST